MVQEEAEATAGLESTTSNVTVEDSAPMPVEDPGTVPMTSHEETAPITIPESLPPPPPPKRMRRGTDIDFLREEVFNCCISPICSNPVYFVSLTTIKFTL
jgi:hypothetical protein